MRISLGKRLVGFSLVSLLFMGCAGLGSKIRNMAPDFGRKAAERSESASATSRALASTSSQGDLALPVRKSLKADQ